MRQLNDRFRIDEDKLIVEGSCDTCGAHVAEWIDAIMHNEWHNELEEWQRRVERACPGLSE